MANEMRDRLVESILNADNYDSFECKLCDKGDDACDCCHAEKVADCLLDDGWIRLHCKVGDTVYIIGLDKKIEKYFVEGICLYQNGLFIEILHNGQGFSLPLNKVFLTKEEAAMEALSKFAQGEVKCSGYKPKGKEENDIYCPFCGAKMNKERKK